MVIVLLPCVAKCVYSNDQFFSGVFVKFHSNGKKFSLMTSSGKTVICDLGRFSISQDTASKYIKHTRPSPSTSKMNLKLHLLKLSYTTDGFAVGLLFIVCLFLLVCCCFPPPLPPPKKKIIK